MSAPTAMPVIFAAHGAPVLLDAVAWMAELAAWVREFDAWAADAPTRFDVDVHLDFRTRAPAADTALPTWERYAPVLVAVGAASLEAPRVTFPIRGFWHDGAFTHRSVQLTGDRASKRP